ncbi:hypothetical protein ACFFSY_10570 [Paenibacillus aurantiacus]|uniref:Uncharacterized protein n=1 Tax=Paenibacillus aurantiacus TaxID=1936118 RepID=A0ABV5KQ63_9BACL
MKNFLVLAVLAVLSSLVLSSSPDAVYAALITEPINSKLEQAQGSFSYQLVSGTETVRVQVANYGNEKMNYQLLDPRGYIWSSGQIDPGKTYRSTYDWFPSLSGTWIIKVDTSEGNPINADIRVKTGVL